MSTTTTARKHRYFPPCCLARRNSSFSSALAVFTGLGAFTLFTLGTILSSRSKQIGMTNEILLIHQSNKNERNDLVHAALLQRQQSVQDEFQQFIRLTQHASPNCSTARILFKPLDPNKETFDGFANEVQFMARYLQIAVATKRVLVVHPEFKSAYAPTCKQNKYDRIGDDHKTDKWYQCLWKPTSNCMRSQNIEGEQDMDQLLPQPLGVGIVSKDSPYFDPQFYGPTRVVELETLIHVDRVKLVDVIPHYERQYGRYWIRSQMAHFLWANQKTAYLREALERRLPKELLESGHRYIAFHIRLTDNVHDLERDFGRDALVTRSFDRYMEIANHIQQQYPDIAHIYIATDNEKIAKLMDSGMYDASWTFHLQQDVKRASSDSGFMWFANHRAAGVGAIAADIETLRRADYLVGSFQSNVYRLAAELNTAYHADKYEWSVGAMDRIFPMDVEWYEDP